MSLTPRQRRTLRGLAHDLTPSVQVGNAGLSDGVIASADLALAAHELIKVKLGQNVALDRKGGAKELATATRSELVGVIGRVWILYRADAEAPRISF